MRTIENKAVLRAGMEAILFAPARNAAAAAVPMDVAAAVQHLVWLREQLDIGTIEGRDLEAAEMEGITLLAQTLREAEGMKRCGQCGALSKAQFNCGSCGAKLPAGKG